MRLPLPLQTQRFGQSRFFAPLVNSTNDEALRQAMDGAPHGHAVWADSQRAGRGRLGRRWESPVGVNLYLSVVLRPNSPVERWPQLTLAAGVAGWEAVAPILNTVDKRPTLKWPNDLWVGSKKLGGILTEAQPAHGFVIVGIGINVNMTAAQIPTDLAEIATTLAIETNAVSDRNELLARLLLELERWTDRWDHEGFAPIRSGWLQRWGMEGWVARLDKTPPLQVILRGLDESGRLLVETETGERRAIMAGEVKVTYPEREK